MLDKILKIKNLRLHESKVKKYLNNTEKSFYLLKKVMEKAKNSKVPLIDGVLEKVQLLFLMFKDWLSGGYTDVPKSTLIAIISALLYFVSPIDFIPDLLAGLGFVDDAAVVIFVAKQINKDLEKYENWKFSGAKTIDMDKN